MHRKITGRTVSICVHPRGAQNKTLISNTDLVYSLTIDPVVYNRDPYKCNVYERRIQFLSSILFWDQDISIIPYGDIDQS